MKKIIAFGFLVTVLLSLGYVSLNKITPDYVADQTVTKTELVVSPQIVETTVFIERITLNHSGFLVVRSLENGRLGQIIEISPYLDVGEHESITIDLGDFYDGNTDLVVVIYQDAENDLIFNDLDQPMRNANKHVIAKYVKTGENVTSELFINTGESTPHMMGGMKMETVRFTNQGYIPSELEVSVGTMVQFVNESDGEMWVASNEHPGHTDLPTFDQFSPSSKSSTYTYTFDEFGTWSFHDNLKPSFEGTVNVIQN
jgi:plastocyanin